MSSRSSRGASRFRRVWNFMYWGVGGGWCGCMFGTLIGAGSGVLVGSAIAVVVGTKNAFVSLVLRGNRLSTAEASAIMDSATVWVIHGLRIGVFTGVLVGIGSGIYYAYPLMVQDEV